VAGGQGGVEEGEGVGGGQGGDAVPGHAGVVGAGQVPGQAGGLLPQAPGQGRGGQGAGVAAGGEGVEEGVGGGVAGLAGGAGGARGGGVQDERGQVGPGGQLVQVPGGVGFGGQYRGEPLGGQGGEHAVVQDGGGVDDGGQGAVGRDGLQQGGQGGAVAGVAGGDGDGGAVGGQVLGQGAGAGGVRAVAGGQQQVPGAVGGGQVAGGRGAEGAGAAGDQHGAAGQGGGQGGGDGQDDLAGVPGLGQVAQRGRGAAQVEPGHRQRRELAGGEQGVQPAQDLGDGGGPGVGGVERLVGHARVGGGHGGGVAQVGLAQLDETAAAGQQPQRGVGQFPGQAVEDHVHAVPAGSGQEHGLEPGAAGGGDLPGRDAHGAQHGVLGRAGGGIHLGAEMPGELHRGHPDPAGGGVHQQPVTRPQAGQAGQAVPGRHERDRDRGRLREAPPPRDRHQQPGIGHRLRGHRREQPRHPVTRRQPGHIRRRLHHDPGALAEGGTGVSDHVQGHGHVAEVHPHRAQRDPDLAREQRGTGAVVGDQGQAVETAGPGQLRPPPRRVRESQQPVPAGPGTGQPGHVPGPGPHRDLGFPGRQRGGQHHGQRPGGHLLAVHIGQDDPAGMLSLRRTRQPPHRRARQIMEIVPGAGGHRPARQHHQLGSGEPVLRQPPLDHSQRLCRNRPHPGWHAGAAVRPGVRAEGDTGLWARAA
jgi:hypothetical protein